MTGILTSCWLILISAAMLPVIYRVMVYLINFCLIMIGKFNSLECLGQGCGLIPNILPDSFAVAPEFDCTEELRVEVDDTDETRPVRYTSDIRLILHTKDLASRAGLAVS